MRLAYATTFNASEVTNWSGTPYHMSRTFQQQDCSLEYIGDLHRKLPKFFKLKQIYKKYIVGERESPRFNVTAARYYSTQVKQRLESLAPHVILAPQINPIAFLECAQPIVLWTDALYAGLVGFYPGFAYHSPSSVQQGNLITQACLSRCRLTIFSSEWAAQTAVSFYGIDRKKVKVVPFGANLEIAPVHSEVQDIIKNRQPSPVKLLFIGKDWYRKGGDIALSVAHALHASGEAVELTIVGCHPPELKNPPIYVKCLGFISKRTIEGKEKIQQLLRDTHFLFVPSRAEAYGIVFCEANAFGIPCLTTQVGGIPTIIQEGVNGKTFPLDAAPED